MPDEKESHIITIEQGTIFCNGEPGYEIDAYENQVIDLTAYIPEGYEFNNWEVVSGDVIIKDKNSAQSKAIVGNKAAKIKAVIRVKQSEKLNTKNTKPSTGNNANLSGNIKSTKIKGKIKAKSRGFLVKWKKQTGINGYQIQISVNKKFKRGTYRRNVKLKKNKIVVKGLKAKKKYYVRIRTYKFVNDEIIFSKWSKKKSVKTK